MRATRAYDLEFKERAAKEYEEVKNNNKIYEADSSPFRVATRSNLIFWGGIA